jgi:hypothetical protein
VILSSRLETSVAETTKNTLSGEAQRQCYVCENCRTMPQNIERTTCTNTMTTTTEATTTLAPIAPVINSKDDNSDSFSDYKEEGEPILVRQRRQGRFS